jgi:cysteate synthase
MTNQQRQDGATGVALAAEPVSTSSLEASHYWLQCGACGCRIDDDGRVLECPGAGAEGSHEPALLMSRYSDAQLSVLADEPGLYRYRRWLPVRRTLAGVGASRTAVYRSEPLSRATGLSEVWVAFNGWWPERGVEMATGTFKHLEAFAVLARLPERGDAVMVVASAGNTGAAFAHACSITNTRCLIIVPEAALDSVSSVCDASVRIVAVRAPADYADAIALSERVARLPGFFREGGVRNVARRDGLGTVMLAAMEAIGRLPDYYFQAIGSGAGAIAVHEAATRLTAGGGGPTPRLMLSQNLPFAPIYHAWKSGRRDWRPLDATESRQQIASMAAKVLSNRQPPYAVRGGLFDALSASRGDMFVANNDEVRAAATLFEELEGIDIEPAGAVAFATLLKSAHAGHIDRNAVVLLNITGGGSRRRRHADRDATRVEPHLTVDVADIDQPQTAERVAALFS